MTKAAVRTRPVREAAWGLGLGLLVHVAVTAAFHGLWRADGGCDPHDTAAGYLWVGMIADIFLSALVIAFMLARRRGRTGTGPSPVLGGFLLSLAYTLAVVVILSAYVATLSAQCPD